MIKELDYIVLEYSTKDLEYIDYLVGNITKLSKEIVDFFEIENFDKKIYVKLFSTLEEFRKECIENAKKLYNLDSYELKDWVSGMSFPKGIYTLCLEEYRKTRSHNNANLDELLFLILHEFVHSCCWKKYGNTKHYAWLSEGLATTISHQHTQNNGEFNATLNEMIIGTSNYKDYYTMFSYVLKKYGRDYILNLLDNPELQKQETPKLYNEVLDFYKSKKEESSIKK